MATQAVSVNGGGSRRVARREPLDAALLLGNMPGPVFAIDGAGRFRFANQAAEQLFSASWHVLAERTIEEMLAPHAPLLDLLRQVQKSDSSISEYGLELSLTRGEVVSVDTHMTPLAEAPDHVLIVLQPCSVARRLDQHMANRVSARSVASLAATLAHEVKNPLSGIRGAAQLLEPYVEEDDKVLVKLICDETDRICQLVDRMEEFGESRPIERKPVNIHQVLEHVRRIAENGFARQHRIVEHYDPSLPDVEGDRDKLIQVFLNLIKNAAEAAPGEGGLITLVTHYRHGLRMTVNSSRERLDLPITVEIKDNGPGVSPELVDHIFEPFVSGKPKGTGLGLPLVAKIVADHGGIVSCVPAEPGAMFRVRLPASRPDRGGAGR